MRRRRSRRRLRRWAPRASVREKTRSSFAVSQPQKHAWHRRKSGSTIQMNDRVTAGESASAGSAVTSRDGAGGRRSDEARGGRGASAISGRRWRSSPSGAGSGGSALEGSKSSRRARERELAYAPGRGIRASTRLDAEVNGTPEASAPTRRAPLRARYDPRERLAARVVVDPRATSDTPRRKAPPRTNATTASRKS